MKNLTAAVLVCFFLLLAGCSTFSFPFSESDLSVGPSVRPPAPQETTRADPQAYRIAWSKCLGGTGQDEAFCVLGTEEGGFVAAGRTNSPDGDVSGLHGSAFDAWVVKLDKDGAVVWSRCLGGSNQDEARCIRQTDDGGFIFAGSTRSDDGDVSGHHSSVHEWFPDVWVVKLDKGGAIEWSRCLGGSGRDEAWDIQATEDGGFILAASTESGDGDVTGPHGRMDAWIVKLDRGGAITWSRCLGGSGNDMACSLVQTEDGGFVAAGGTVSDDGDAVGLHGPDGDFSDAWVVRLSESGDVVWSRCLGGSKYDWANSVCQAYDGGFLVTGATFSDDGDVTGYHAGGSTPNDAWIVKLDKGGDFLWGKCLGGSDRDEIRSVLQTRAGGYVAAGISASADGDAAGNRSDQSWAGIPSNIWVMYLSSIGDIRWSLCMGGSREDFAYSIAVTDDGGLALAGHTLSEDGDVGGFHTGSGYDAWIVKLEGIP